MSTSIITKPKVQISPGLLDQIKSQTEEAGQVVLHFIIRNGGLWPMGIRIWPTSFLYDQGSEHVSDLVHVENITMAPNWQEVPPLTETFFTLIFSGLPKSCTSFDFEEQCNSEGGQFFCKGIERNEMDVYYLEIS